MAAASPPSGVLSLRVPLSALPRVVDLRGPKADPWPRAFPDPYTTTPEQAFGGKNSAPLPAHGDGSRLPPPFALPLGYHMVCVLTGYSSSSAGGASNNTTGGGTDSSDRSSDTDATGSTVGSGGSGAVGGLPHAAASELGPGGAISSAGGGGNSASTGGPARFHIWWPIAPNGYVAMGAVVTPASWVLAQRAAPTGQTGMSTSGLASPPPASGFTSPVAAARPGPDSISAGGSARTIFVNTLRPTVPDLGAVVCVHVSLCRSAALRGFTPMPWLGLNIPPRPREEQVVLRGWQGRGASQQPLAPDGAPASSADLRQPEDEWVVPEHPLAAGAAGAAGLHILAPVSEAVTPLDSGSGGDGSQQPVEASSGSTAPSDDAGSAIAAAGLRPGMTQAKVARLRAARSRAAALYSVANRVGTFVVPVPVSVQRVSDLRARIDAAIAGQRSQLPHSLSGSSHGNLDGQAALSRGDSEDAEIAAPPPLPPSAPASRQESLDFDELLALSVASSAASQQHSSPPAAAESAEAASVPLGRGTGLAAAYPQDLIVASTALRPVPEHADATYAKAHALAAAVAYELGPALLMRMSAPGVGDGAECAGGVEEEEEEEALAFEHQHWGATSEVVARAPPQPHAAGTSAPPTSAPPGKGVRRSITLATTAPPPASAPGALPVIVAVRVLNSAILGAALAADMPGLAAATGVSTATAGVLAAAPHTVIAVDARGGVHRCRVTAVPTHPAHVVQVRLQSARRAAAPSLSPHTHTPPPLVPPSPPHRLSSTKLQRESAPTWAWRPCRVTAWRRSPLGAGAPRQLPRSSCRASRCACCGRVSRLTRQSSLCATSSTRTRRRVALGAASMMWGRAPLPAAAASRALPLLLLGQTSPQCC